LPGNATLLAQIKSD